MECSTEARLRGGDQQTATSSTRSGEPAKRHLFSLPQELQDLIFDLAYPRIEGFRVMQTKDWDVIELKRGLADPNYVARPKPKITVSAFLVSKQFFRTAAKAYVGN